MKSLSELVSLSLGIVLLSLLSACSRQAETKSNQQTAKPRIASPTAVFPKDDAIAYAVRFADAMPRDEDGIQTQSKILEEVVQACLRRNESTRAAAIAGKIKGWQRGTAFADIARHEALAGHTNEAARLILLAEGWRAFMREQTQDTNMGWTTGRIRDHLASARAALGETEESTALLQKPMFDVNARVVSQWIAGVSHQTNAAFMQTLSVVLTNKDYAVQQGLGLGMMAWADRQKTLTPEAAKEIIAVVRATLPMQPVQYQLPVQAELVRFLQRLGRADETEEMSREFEMNARSMSNGYYLSTGLADAAVLLQQTNTNRAANLIQEAESIARQCTDASKSAALSYVAERAADMRQIEMAQRVYLDALAAATVPPSAVPRLQRLVETCASMGGAGVPLTPEIKNKLNELAAREEGAKR